MGLLDFHKPKWRHKNPAVRLKAVTEIDPGETATLAGLCREDPDQHVRRAAIARLADLATLELLGPAMVPDDQPFLAARKEQLCYELVINAPDIEAWRDNLTGISSPPLLAKVAVAGSQPALRLAAVTRLDDQHLLAGVVEHNCGKETAQAAMAKIEAEELLRRLVKSGASKTTRRLAAAKLAELAQQRNQPGQEQILTEKLAGLLAEAVQLQHSSDMDTTAAGLTSLKLRWQGLDSNGGHPATAVFANICNDFEEKFQEIRALRRSEQEKVARYERQQSQMDEICTTIERLIGSTAAEADSLTEQAVRDWTALLNDPDGRPVLSSSMAKRFAKACQAYTSKREKIGLEKAAIAVIEKNCAATRQLIATGNLTKAGRCLAETEKKLALRKFKYFNGNAVQEILTEVAQTLAAAEKESRTANLVNRQQICTELDNLANSASGDRIAKNLQDLQQAWQQLPALTDPAGEELEQRFLDNVARLTLVLKNLENEQDWQLWANLSLKEKLAERVEALDQQENLEIVVTVVKESQAEWKQIGPSPHAKTRKIWDRFQAACTLNFNRAEPYLAELKVRRAAAMDRRREMCAMATQLAESTEWQKTAAILKGLQLEWKNLPPGSRRKESELYQQFRAACNLFFARRQEDYQAGEQERQQHLLAKETLCEAAEKLSTDPQRDYAGKFRALQADWQKIGPIPRALEKEVWKRFRAAYDNYFTWLEEDCRLNLGQKVALCEKLESLLATTPAEVNHQELAEQITDLHQQWQAIGPVPRDKNEEINQRFHGQCDAYSQNRQQQIALDKKERQQNLATKEELLAQAEQLGCQGSDAKTTAQLRKIQKKWQESGPTSRDRELDDRFQNLCDAFLGGRSDYFTDLKREQLANLKKKEVLCLRLENILGITPKSGNDTGPKALTLAEQLKQAMEDNFMLAGRRHEKKSVEEEIRRIETEWDQIGTPPYKQAAGLTARFRKSLDGYYRQ